MNAIFDARRKLRISPSVVANKIVEIVQSKMWKIRHPTGPDAEAYLLIVKQTFGMDLDL
jgi:hypothetical protein